MDRLSAYAARESESDPPEDRQKTEEEATAALLEKLRISKEVQKSDNKPNAPEDNAANGEPNNGEPNNGEPSTEQPEQPSQAPKEEPEASNGVRNGENAPRKRGIPENVKLYEIFYDQVTHLVNAQRLHIQDTIALLVSLSNLALYGSPHSLQCVNANSSQ